MLPRLTAKIEWKRYAPLPLRAFIGGGLILHGGIKLFAEGGHANIAYLIGRLGVPFAGPMGWVVGVVEFAGGLAILLGVWFKVATIANALNIGGLLLLGYLAGGIPAPLPGGDPLPDFREAFLILAGVVSLLLSGPGPFTASTTVAAAVRRRNRGATAEC
jgi:putative oxidoreductase